VDIDIRGMKLLVGPEARVRLAISPTFAAPALSPRQWRILERGPRQRQRRAVMVPSYWKSMANDWQIESQLFVRLGRHNTVTAGGNTCAMRLISARRSTR